MRIVVIGGTGLVGAKLVDRIRQNGHEAVVATRSTGVNVVTGEGLTEVLAGADAVVDVSNPGYRDAVSMRRFFEASGAQLFAAESSAGIVHHIAFSAVGAGHVDGGYYVAKAAQEALVAVSGIPFTIVRSTPLFEYIYAIVDYKSDRASVHVPPVRMRPIAADDVARALARIATQPPADAIVELAGPDTYRLSALAEQILTANEDARDVIVDPDATFFGAHVGDEPLTGGARPLSGVTSFDDWLRRSLIPA